MKLPVGVLAVRHDPLAKYLSPFPDEMGNVATRSPLRKRWAVCLARLTSTRSGSVNLVNGAWYNSNSSQWELLQE